MPLPKLTIRRFLLLALMLASLIVLADSIARNELRNALGDVAFAVSGTAGGGSR